MVEQLLQVLIVDDEALVGSLVASLVERVGFRTKVVESGVDALKEVAAGDIGLVITDLRMPKMDGFTLCKELTKLMPELPVMAMSGSGPLSVNADLKKALKLGARSAVTKPFKLDEFYQAMTVALGPGKFVGQTGR